MKSKMLPVAVALASLFAYTGAHADGFFPPHYHTHISLNNKASFKFKSETDSKYTSKIKVKGHINVIAASQAVVDDKQLSHDNYVSNENVRNSATAGSNVLNGATGNVGVNVAAGNNNQQANQAAISAIAKNVTAPHGDDDGKVVVNGSASASSSASNQANANNNHDSDVSQSQTAVSVASASLTQNVNIYNNEEDRAWGTASDATINVLQDNRWNETRDVGTRNSAQVGNNALNGASGNIGVNVAAGSNNQQKNDLAVATGGNRTASASITTGQQSFDNSATTSGTTRTTTEDVHLGVHLFGGYIGGGAIETDRGEYPDHDGDELKFQEAGLIGLEGCVTGQMPVTTTVAAVNSATLGSNVLNHVSGNIGVNVAAGSGNQQVNSLAIAAVK